MKYLSMAYCQKKSYQKITQYSKNLWTLASMDLTKIEFHQHPKWQLIESSPQRLIYKSPYINDKLASIELELEGESIYGIIKSSSNPIGNRVILRRDMPMELLLMLIVEVLAEDIFEYGNV